MAVARRKPNLGRSNVSNVLEEELREYLALEDEIRQKNARLAELHQSIQKRIEKRKDKRIALEIEPYGTVIAELVKKVGRATRIFDTEAVYKALGIDDFLKVVKVQATKVSQFLSQKEIDRVSYMEPGKEKPPVLEIKIPGREK